MKICDGQFIRISCKKKNVFDVLSLMQSKFLKMYEDIELINGGKLYFRVKSGREYGFSGKDMSVALRSIIPDIKISNCYFENGRCNYSTKW